MSTVVPYPVQVTAEHAESPSRWLWLIKWLLLIPHVLALTLLWPAYAVLTVVAFGAILVTGRYPRVIFAFNRGVLRWTWRVWFYGYGALGTDEYPPYTLGPAPWYPATLDVERPERLSRGRVLVQAWLLALPHLLLVLLFSGTSWLSWTATTGSTGTTGSAPPTYTACWGEGCPEESQMSGPVSGPVSAPYAGGPEADFDWFIAPGLITLLAAFAGIAILFTSRYPRGIFDMLIGLNRWVLRVVAYVSLMTDRYPPFRLDLGGSEEGPAGEREPMRDDGPPWPGAAVALVLLGAVTLTLIPFILLLLVIAMASALGAGAGVGAALFLLTTDPGVLFVLGVEMAIGAAFVGAGVVVAALRMPPEPAP